MKLSKAEIDRRLSNSCRDSCINWMGAPIRTGDHVIVKVGGEDSPLVGQLIDIKEATYIPSGEIKCTGGPNKAGRMALVRWFHFLDEKDVRRPSAGERCHLPTAIKEVCQTTSVEWVNALKVANICFIFHLDAIQKGMVSCGGMDRVFFIRFQKITGDIIPLKPREFKPFYRDPKFPFQEGFPEAIWSQMTCLKVQLSKEMSCGGAWDGRTKTAKLNGVPPSFFGYLKHQFEAECCSLVQYNKINTSRPKKQMFDNFAAQQVRISTLVHQIRVLEESELDVVRKVCGNSFGVGLTVAVPTMKEVRRSSIPMNGTIWLRDDHEVRIVSCLPTERDLDASKGKRCLDVSHEDTVYERPTKLRCSYRGVDFRHMQGKNGVWELVVQARFLKLKGRSAAVRKAQSLFLNPEGIVSDVESEDIEVNVGDYIRIGTPPNLNTYVVDSIDQNGVVCCKDVTECNDEPIYMSLKEANSQYNKYIRY
jgi:hypothetical protein